MSDPDQTGGSSTAADKRALLEKLLREKAVAASTHPQSFGQQRLWFVDRLAPGRTGYNTSQIVRLKGRLDSDLLERAFNEIIRRHAICRTVFRLRDGEPVQQVLAEMPLKLNRVRFVDFSAEDQQHEIEHIVHEKILAVLDLENGPLIHVTLLELADEDHVMILVMHHIITDGWSCGIVYRELSALYNAYLEGRDSPLADLPQQYADFTRWQRDLVKAEATAHQLEYWRTRLADAPPMLELSTDYRRPALQSFKAGIVARRMPDELVGKLNQLVSGHNSSLFMVLLTTFYILLWRYTGQNDIVVGSPVAGRNRSDFEQLIGLFINVLPVRAELDGDLDFIATLERVRSMILEAMENQDVPFDAMVSELRPDRAQDHHPVFQVMFTVQQPLLQHLELRGLEKEALMPETRPLAYDLTLVALQDAGALTLQFNYSKDLFSAETIERMTGHYRQLLQAIVSQPQQRISDLPMLTDHEYERTVFEWNRVRTVYPRESAIQQLFEQQADRTPDVTAAEYGAQCISYTDLNRRANRIAHYLNALGVEKGALVGLCMNRSIDQVAAMLAILKAGAAYVPLDPDYPQERIAFMLEDTAAGVVLTESMLAAQLPRIDADIVCVDRDEHIERQPGHNPDIAAGAGDLAYVIYTSGSTGVPKGVAVPHRGVVRLVVETNYVQLLPSDRVAQASVCSFDAATFEIWGPLLNGACTVGVPRDVSLNPPAFAAYLKDHDISVLFLTTALFNQMARESADVFRSLRYVLFGGQAVDPAWVRAVLDNGAPQHLLHVYGPTETTTFATWFEITQLDESAVTVPIGHPISNSTAYVLDVCLNPVPVGVAGELYLGGDGVAREYLHRPELNSAAFIRNPFSGDENDRLYRTGDWVRYREDGAIEFIGRRDSQVKIRGFRIELGEIEAALVKLDSIDDAAVVVREQESGDKRLLAYVVPVARSSRLTRETLQEQLHEHLPDYMIPGVFVNMAALPLNANGKVDKKALPETAGDALLAGTASAPRNQLEKQIADIFRDVLRVDNFGVNDNFFDLGGHSLLLVKVHSRLSEECGCDLSIVDLFEYPTVEALAKRIGGGEAAQEDAFQDVRERIERQRRRAGGYQPIAIVGLSGRFPSASSPDELWEQLCEGFEPIEEFSIDELLAEGVSETLLDDPDYVRSGIVLDDVGMWDATFFGFTPREAQVLDPQQRLFMECAWEALEKAGCDPERYHGAIGVFAGIGINRYQKLIDSDPVLSESFTDLENLISGDKDFVSTRVSYKFNLTGPSLTVQTACSTSLVAVHMAVRCLQEYESDMALAGGVSIKLPQKTGYMYYPEGIASPDCHCRAFDARAQGTMRGNGACIVVLKRLDDAIADGDTIHAVIRGSAINNDGAGKVGYTAPGVEGQAAVIAAAQAEANIDPASIGYIEAHGTGTPLGDPVEVKALTQAFRAGTDAVGYCGIGSIKTNIGHLDAAAGCTGLLKAALSVEHGRMPPSLHYETPNPEIDFEHSPFYVVDRLTEWPDSSTPRRAAVSSFGVGGTNAHVILEQAPVAEASSASRPMQLLPLSARTETALEKSIQQLADYVSSHQEIPLADIAWTLQSGRREFDHRAAIVCRDHAEAIEKLAAAGSRLSKGVAQHHQRPVVFLFSGQGSQYPDMGRGLYDTEPVFREAVDTCIRILESNTSINIEDILYPDKNDKEESDEMLRDTAFAQPALFITEYAMAQLWISWGIRPEAMIGHSIGEYIAACIAGVMSLEHALLLVAERGRMISELPGGTMIAVPLAESELLPRLGDTLSLAAVNAPRLCVVSGEDDAVNALAASLQVEGIDPIELHTSHAFHSAMMEPVMEAFAARVKQVDLHAPSLPYLSNVSGDWITDEQATDPDYWATHLRRGVRFADAVTVLLEDDARVFLEVGPGKTLTGLVRQQLAPDAAPRVFGSLHHPRESVADDAYLLDMLAGLWISGVRVDWPQYHAGESRRRVPLPTYPFDRQMYWVSGQIKRLEADTQAKQPRLADWFYTQEWARSVLPAASQEDEGIYLVFSDRRGLADALLERLRASGGSVVSVRAAGGFSEQDAGDFTIHPASPNDYRQLLEALRASGRMPRRIVHLLGVDNVDSETAEQYGFYSLMYLAQALGAETGQVDIDVITEGVHEINGREQLQPDKALVLGMCRVIPEEYPGVRCRQIDVELDDGDTGDIAAMLLAEVRTAIHEPVLAYRGGQRRRPVFEHLPLATENTRPARLRDAGVYLVTGGLGGIGLALAEYLAGAVQAKLVLTGRSAFPAAEEWQDWLASHDDEDATVRRIRQLERMRADGAEIMVASVDVTDEDAMRSLLDQVHERFGPINGVVHCAGVGGGGVIQLKQKEEAAAALAPKVDGARLLYRMLDHRNLDFIVLCSSLSSILGGASRSDYCAANAWLDAFAVWSRRQSGVDVVSINWDSWREVGMAVDVELPPEMAARRDRALRTGINVKEGVEAFRRILSGEPWLPQVLVSTVEFSGRLPVHEAVGEADTFAASAEPAVPESTPERPPQITSGYAAPTGDTETPLADLWQDMLGVARVGVNDNFFELGGHSLLALRVIGRTNKQFDIELALQDLFDNPTVAELARHIDSLRGELQEDRAAVEALLDEVEQLGDAELEALLGQVEQAGEEAEGQQRKPDDD